MRIGTSRESSHWRKTAESVQLSRSGGSTVELSIKTDSGKGREGTNKKGVSAVELWTGRLYL